MQTFATTNDPLLATVRVACRETGAIYYATLLSQPAAKGHVALVGPRHQIQYAKPNTTAIYHPNDERMEDPLAVYVDSEYQFRSPLERGESRTDVGILYCRPLPTLDCVHRWDIMKAKEALPSNLYGSLPTKISYHKPTADQEAETVTDTIEEVDTGGADWYDEICWAKMLNDTETRIADPKHMITRALRSTWHLFPTRIMPLGSIAGTSGSMAYGDDGVYGMIVAGRKDSDPSDHRSILVPLNELVATLGFSDERHWPS